MRLEMYVRDGELGEIFENLFGLFHKYLVFVQCTQTHVVLYGSPPAKVDAPRLVLEGDAPTNRDKARRLERFYAVRYAPYHLLRLRRWPHIGFHLLARRLVKVDFGHGRQNRAQRIPREVYVDLVYGRGR